MRYAVVTEKGTATDGSRANVTSRVHRGMSLSESVSLSYSSA